MKSKRTYFESPTVEYIVLVKIGKVKKDGKIFCDAYMKQNKRVRHPMFDGLYVDSELIQIK